MSHTSIALRLSKPEMDRPEGVQVIAEGARWQSPGGGWLGVRSGKWRQQPDGLHLLDTAGVDVVVCRGLNFLLCTQGATGSALYPGIGDAGSWLVAAVID